MIVFIDSSAFYSLVANEDATFSLAVETWEKLTQADDSLVTNNYVVVECLSLIQRRLGVDFVRHLQTSILSLIAVEWLDEEQHTSAAQRLFKANRRMLSLVDCSAFETMHRLGLETVFTFDKHFREEGFNVIPEAR